MEPANWFNAPLFYWRLDKVCLQSVLQAQEG